MEKKKTTLRQEFTKGIIKENPVLRLVLGCCATLAVTTAASNAIGMGAATTFVLVCSNGVISLLRKVIPDKVRIPAFITIVAGFVTIVQLFIQAFSPALDKALGVFLPLIVVICIILGRAEMFASKNKVLPSLLDGLGMGVGFTATLLAMGIIRELLGGGHRVWAAHPLGLYGAHHHLPAAPGRLLRLRDAGGPGGQALPRRARRRNPTGCAHCPLAASCTKLQEGKNGKEARELMDGQTIKQFGRHFPGGHPHRKLRAQQVFGHLPLFGGL